MRYDDGIRQYQTTKPFEGVIPNLDRRWKETDSSWVREELERFQHEAKCETCNGARLKPEALAVKIAGLNISQTTEFAHRRGGEVVPRAARPSSRPSSARSPPAS